MRQLTIAICIIAVALLASSVILYLASDTAVKQERENLVGQQYREIALPAGFVNTDGSGVTIGENIGKNVVLLEFMSYSCVNCQRSFPHIVAWNDAYKDKGLTIIGVHTPEFAFEHEKQNVEGAMQKSNITFPIVLDNVYGTWNAYGNHYWPRTFLIDRSGTIVYDHIGGGDYEETEAKIRELLGLE